MCVTSLCANQSRYRDFYGGWASIKQDGPDKMIVKKVYFFFIIQVKNTLKRFSLISASALFATETRSLSPVYVHCCFS